MKFHRKAKLFISLNFPINKDTRINVGWIGIKDDGERYFIPKQSILSKIISGRKHYSLGLDEFNEYVEFQDDGTYLIYFQSLDGNDLSYLKKYEEENKKRMEMEDKWRKKYLQDYQNKGVNE